MPVYAPDVNTPDLRHTAGGSSYLHYDSTEERFELIERALVVVDDEWADETARSKRALAYRNARRLRKIAHDVHLGDDVKIVSRPQEDGTWAVVARGTRHHVDTLHTQLPE